MTTSEDALKLAERLEEQAGYIEAEWGSAVVVRNASRALRALVSERDGLRAARIAYAKEFPLDAEGEPDVGSIHANIRSLVAERDALKEAARDLTTAAMSLTRHRDAYRPIDEWERFDTAILRMDAALTTPATQEKP